MKPFIPDFIPAVGDIDAFITVPRPDSKVDKLGLACIDEPCAKQSDPTVLDLQIRAITKQTHFRAMQVSGLKVGDRGYRILGSDSTFSLAFFHVSNNLKISVTNVNLYKIITVFLYN